MAVHFVFHEIGLLRRSILSDLRAGRVVRQDVRLLRLHAFGRADVCSDDDAHCTPDNDRHADRASNIVADKVSNSVAECHADIYTDPGTDDTSDPSTDYEAIIRANCSADTTANDHTNCYAALAADDMG